MACGLMMKIDTSPSPGGLQVDHGGFRGKLPGAISPLTHHVDVHAEEFFEVEHESGHIENGSVRGEGDELVDVAAGGIRAPGDAAEDPHRAGPAVVGQFEHAVPLACQHARRPLNGGNQDASKGFRPRLHPTSLVSGEVGLRNAGTQGQLDLWETGPCTRFKDPG